MCGEKFSFLLDILTMLGSPPRVRGKVVCHFPSFTIIRITPACAGKSARRNFFREFDQDHPRVCGEKLRTKLRDNVQMGSPPRVRGKEFLSKYLR